MTGIGQSRSRQSSSRRRSAALTAPPAPGSRPTTSGSASQKASTSARGRVALQREPDVAVGQHAHRLQHVAGRERRGRAGRAAGDAEPAPVELGHQRLAVDVEARERHEVGESSTGVADDLDVRHLGGHPAAYDVDELVLAGVDLVALGDHRLQRGGRGQDGRDVLEAGRPLVDAVVAGERVAPPRALAHQQHARPRPARPTCAPTPRRRPAGGQREPAHRRAGVGEERDVVRQLELADRLDGADLVVGALQRDDADAGPSRSREVAASTRPSPSPATSWPRAAPVDRRAARPSARPRSATTASPRRDAAHQPQQPEVDRVRCRWG